MSRYYNAKRSGDVLFAVGDKVWLDARDIRTTRPAKKLDDKWFGPYPVERVISCTAYRLKLPASLKVHPTFHVSRLRRFTPDSIPDRTSAPPRPVIGNGREEEEVEEVLNSRLYRRKLQYLVKWKGWSRENNTWEPAEHLENAPRLVSDFHRAHPSAPAPPAATVLRPRRGAAS